MNNITRLLALAYLQARDDSRPCHAEVEQLLAVALKLSAKDPHGGASTRRWALNETRHWLLNGNRGEDPDDEDMEAHIHWREQLVRAALGEKS